MAVLPRAHSSGCIRSSGASRREVGSMNKRTSRRRVSRRNRRMHPAGRARRRARTVGCGSALDWQGRRALRRHGGILGGLFMVRGAVKVYCRRIDDQPRSRKSMESRKDYIGQDERKCGVDMGMKWMNGRRAVILSDAVEVTTSKALPGHRGGEHRDSWKNNRQHRSGRSLAWLPPEANRGIVSACTSATVVVNYR
jgi:hypothetical protein